MIIVEFNIADQFLFRRLAALVASCIEVPVSPVEKFRNIREQIEASFLHQDLDFTIDSNRKDLGFIIDSNRSLRYLPKSWVVIRNGYRAYLHDTT